MSRKISFPTLKIFYLVPLATALTLVSCHTDEPDSTSTSPEPDLVVEQTEYTIDAIENRDVIISFTASDDWTITVTGNGNGDNADWLTAVREHGSEGRQEAILSAEVNFEETERTAYANIVCKGQTIQVTITQTGVSADTNYASLFDPELAQMLQELGIISDAQNITRQDMDNNIAAVTELNISWSGINNLESIKYFKSLTHLDCSYNTMRAKLDLSQNTALIELDCSFTTSLTMLDISKCTKLEILKCSGNRLSTLDVSQNTKLKVLECYFNNLTSLDVSKCTELEILECSGNGLTTLDVSQNKLLTKLNCSNNLLTTLDISRNTLLTKLDCSYNLLTDLDISQNTALTECWFSYNPGDGMSTFPLTVWFEDLPENLNLQSTRWEYEGKTISTVFKLAE